MSEYNFINNYFHMNELKEYYEPLDIENILKYVLKNHLLLFLLLDTFVLIME